MRRSRSTAKLDEAQGKFDRAHERWLRTVALRRATTSEKSLDLNLASALESLGFSELRRKNKSGAVHALREARAIYAAARPNDRDKLEQIDAHLTRIDT